MTAQTIPLSFCLALSVLAQAAEPARPERVAPRSAATNTLDNDRKLVPRFDRNGDEMLDARERQAARAHLLQRRAAHAAPGTRRSAPDLNPEPAGPGRRLQPSEAPAHPGKPLYDDTILRTLFLRLDGVGWEEEMAEFHDTDVELPATLAVDGRTYRDVGVSFRGDGSFHKVAAGRKRPLKLALDAGDPDQNLLGYRTLSLLNGYGDPTLVRALLYYRIAREYVPAPRANHVRVVINDESWGVFLNLQHFNADFARDWFRVPKGARWKAAGATGRAGLHYLGPDLKNYQTRYEMKSKENPGAWADLVRLCRVLHETPGGDLPAALAPQLDVHETLRLLAVENALVNSDGHWHGKPGDYHLFQDDRSRFHLVPLDADHCLRAPRGKAWAEAGPRAGIELDPLAGANDPDKPLLHRLLAVPEFRRRYLETLKAVATQWLDWTRLGPVVDGCQALIRDEVRQDTRRLHAFAAFTNGVHGDLVELGAGGERRSAGLKEFVQARRAYLLTHPLLRALPAETSTAQK